MYDLYRDLWHFISPASLISSLIYCVLQEEHVYTNIIRKNFKF